VSTLTLNQEFGVMRLRFRRTLAVSIGLHLLFFAGLIAVHQLAPLRAPIVEITWLDQEPVLLPDPVLAPEAVALVNPAAPETPKIESMSQEATQLIQNAALMPRQTASALPEAATIPEAVTPALRPTVPEVQEVPVVRETTPATVIMQVEPAPTAKEELTRSTGNVDRVREKLRSLAPSSVADKAMAALPAGSVDPLRIPNRDLAHGEQRTPPPILTSDRNPRRGAVALVRGPTSSNKTAAVVAATPNRSSASGSGPNATAAARPDADSHTVLQLGGATLSGLVADRQVLTHPMPAYPVWATTQAVEATVTLYFLVMPDGRVKENVQVQKTAGFQDFDENAVAALRQWRFEALAGEGARDQWGTITFRYRLSD